MPLSGVEAEFWESTRDHGKGTWSGNVPLAAITKHYDEHGLEDGYEFTPYDLQADPESRDPVRGGHILRDVTRYPNFKGL